ncbi:MAG: tRNA lysidine(34) synthetase TilS [Bryobacteraceae bacterium]
MAGNLVERVAGIISRYSMLSRGARVGVGVSGGADSVVLLHILQRLSTDLEIMPIVLHVNHQLRGAESDQDEEFVRALSESLKIECFVEHAKPEKGNLEEGARNARREFFQRSTKQHSLARIALGHTRSDQAETVLFRFLRGSGLAGLAGMRMVTQDNLIRPLLTTSRDEVRNWAVEEGIAWREDSSNADIGFSRNRLRRQTIPALARQFNPELEGVLAGTAELAQAEEDYWAEQVERKYEQITKRTHLGSILHVPSLVSLHTAVQRRLIRRAMVDVRGDLRSIEMAHVNAILALFESSHGHDRAIVPGVDAIRSYDRLLLAIPGELKSRERHYCFEIRPGEERQLPFGAGSISIDWVKPECEFYAKFKEEQEVTEVVDLGGEALSRCGSRDVLCVRNWKPGDRLHRPGHVESEKIKSLFQEYKVALWDRRHWPVVVSGEEVVWVRQFGSAAKFQSSGEGRLLRLVYREAPVNRNLSG